MDVNFIGGMPEGYRDVAPEVAAAKAQAVMTAEQVRPAAAEEPSLEQQLASLEAAIQAAEASEARPSLPVLREQRGALAAKIAENQRAQAEERERQRKAAHAKFTLNLKEAEQARHDFLVLWCEASLLLGRLADLGEELYKDSAALRVHGPEDPALRQRLDAVTAPPRPQVEAPGLRVGTMNLGFNWNISVVPSWEKEK